MLAFMAAFIAFMAGADAAVFLAAFFLGGLHRLHGLHGFGVGHDERCVKRHFAKRLISRNLGPMSAHTHSHMMIAYVYVRARVCVRV